MSDDGRPKEEPYEAPKVEDIETEAGPAVTAAGETITET
jgi:hypothetical protein